MCSHSAQNSGRRYYKDIHLDKVLGKNPAAASSPLRFIYQPFLFHGIIPALFSQIIIVCCFTHF